MRWQNGRIAIRADRCLDRAGEFACHRAAWRGQGHIDLDQAIVADLHFVDQSKLIDIAGNFGIEHRLQRGNYVAGITRALAFRPRLVLLDEPFSALDAPVREELRRELRRLQREAGLSTVIVTHDPEEAALLADEILIVDEGALLQAGPRAEVFARPASPHVARLLGIPNLIHATVAEPGVLAVGAPGPGVRPLIPIAPGSPPKRCAALRPR